MIILISLVIGLIVALFMKTAMNTARFKSSALDYVKKGSFKLTLSQDLFMYSTVSKTAKPKS